MRAAAEVGERTIRVERDGFNALVADQILNQLNLVVLLLTAEALKCVSDAHLFAFEALPRFDVLLHLSFNRFEVVLADDDSVGELKVVVEAAFDGWADRHLHAGIELSDGCREHVCGVVTDQR